MSQPFIGEVRMVGFTFAPSGWAYCNGQLQSIADNGALFALIGTIYGGDGVDTFALPDLRGRSVTHQGQLQGGSTYTIGQSIGTETVTLTTGQLPTHTHAVAAVAGPAVPNPGPSPANKLPNGQANAADAAYGTGAPSANMLAGAITSTGGGQPHDNVQPLLAINFVISLFGIFPSRN